MEKDMNETQNNARDALALFRYGLIADFIHLPKGAKGIGERLTEKASNIYTIPNSNRGHIAVETLRNWLKKYRKGGFEALKPKSRIDAGQSHSLPRDVVDFICQLKEDHPDLSVQLIIKEARISGKIPPGLPLPLSTVHRLLSKAGLMRKPEAPNKDHRRFSFEFANDLWMSDVMHGPAVPISGKVKRKTYLIALIDDSTRVVPFASFALSENTSSFLPVFKQAILRRGIPKRLFVDNGAAFRSQQLQLVCAKMGTTLIHARPYHPEAKGKQERWFRTVRLQLLPRLTHQDLQSLETLNHRLWAYIEGEYHQSPHRGLNQLTPLDAWANRSSHVQLMGHRTDIDDLFLFEEKRKVQNDRTISLHGIAFEVETSLVGKTVTLRFDPEHPKAPIQVWYDLERFIDAKPVDPLANCFVRRARSPKNTDETKDETALPVSTLRLSDMPEKQNKGGC
jgi:transposase InsO family protein